MTFRIIKGNQEVAGTLPASDTPGAHIELGGHEPQHFSADLDPIDESLLHALVEYLKNLTVTQGRQMGRKLRVLPWQKDFILGAFERKTRSASLRVGFESHAARANLRTRSMTEAA